MVWRKVAMRWRLAQEVSRLDGITGECLPTDARGEARVDTRAAEDEPSPLRDRLHEPFAARGERHRRTHDADLWPQLRDGIREGLVGRSRAEIRDARAARA